LIKKQEMMKEILCHSQNDKLGAKKAEVPPMMKMMKNLPKSGV
jgi:hypothetical protein